MDQIGADYDWMVFDTYRPRPGATEAGYEQWMREVDCPLINSIPGMASYSCWRIDRTQGVLAPFARGQSEPFTHFGFFGARERADIQRFFGNPRWIEHGPTWIRLWSCFPEAGDDTARNFCFTLFKRAASNGRPRSTRVLLLPFTAQDDRSLDAALLERALRVERWERVEHVVGELPYTAFHLLYLDGTEDSAALMRGYAVSAEGNLIAAPS